MSQQKVDRYKQEKANRKSTMKKQKREKYVRRGVAGVVIALLVCWAAYSGYSKYEASRPTESVEINYDSIGDFSESLDALMAE